MSELTLFLLQIVFLGLLWFFVFFIIYALRVDLFGERVRRLMDASGNEAMVNTHIGTPPAAQGKNSSQARLVIISGPKEGMEILLNNEPLTIGRSSESGLVLRDEFTSTHHARLIPGPESWVVQDLDSTNGTQLNGRKIRNTANLVSGDVIRIGATSFELRS
ncbi:MAG: FHA domain-containing protein [Microbacteriaceae bacterium]